ncbi:MAG: CPBP family intramembrane metalloprotease [Micrococcus sp.]|nr:CPBP family intramembrane metalloprotease [Micrococcus sp.]
MDLSSWQPVVEVARTTLPLIAALLLALFAIPARAGGLRIMVAMLGFVVIQAVVVAAAALGFVPTPEHPRVMVLHVPLSAEPTTLLVLTLASALAALAVALVLRSRQRSVSWTGGTPLLAIALGLLGAAVLCVPGALLLGGVERLATYLGIEPLDHIVATSATGLLTLVPLALLCLAAAAVPEVLFRGFLQAELEGHGPVWRAVLANAALYSSAYGVLALVVLATGWVPLAFTFAVGLVCALVSLRGGVLAATLAHGGAVFVLVSGLL